MNLIARFEEWIEAKGFLETECFLTDLELSADSEDPPADLYGRDIVLQRLRQHAPWIPVILYSRYVLSTQSVLQAISGHGFDAILNRQFFSWPSTADGPWREIRKRAQVNRVACLTGRSQEQIEKLLESTLDLQYGLGVQSQLTAFDPEDLIIVMKLLGLNCKSVVLDSIVPGFSGLKVIRATSVGDSGETEWILKIGSQIDKLQAEIREHRRAFVGGITHHWMVPPLWWAPVVWRNLGAIAYEFEKGSRDLQQTLGTTSLSQTAAQLEPLFERFHKTTYTKTIVPRSVLKTGPHLDSESDYGGIINHLRDRTQDPLLDNSLRVLCGRQHGDLHTRNILFGPRGPVLIDLAHFRLAQDSGLPILDLAKLVVDIWVFCPVSWSLAEIATGSVLTNQEWAGVSDCFLEQASNPSLAERKLFALASLNEMALYQSYADVSLEKRTSLREFLKRFSLGESLAPGAAST